MRPNPRPGRRLRARALASAAALALAAALTVAPAQARTLVFCSEGSPESLDPARATTTTTMNATWPLYNGLVEFAPGTTDIRPALAEAWTVSEDGRTYEFVLRTDVRFHANARFRPSRPLDAEDVVFSFTRQLRPDHPFHVRGQADAKGGIGGGTAGGTGGGFAYVRDLGLADLIETVEAVDARRVRFRLREADTTFLANLALALGGILSAEYAGQMAAAGTPEALAGAPIGTGPFAFAGYQPDQTLRYAAFPGYWRRPAAAPGAGERASGERPDGLVFSITPNPAVRLTKLRAGECGVMAFPAVGDLDAIRADPALRLLSLAELNVAYLALNTGRPPLDDVRVRRAINLAVDRQAIVASVYGPAGTLARGPLPPGTWASDGGSSEGGGSDGGASDAPAPDAAAPDPGFDRAEALRLLAEAGLPDGFEADLWYLPVSRPYNPNGRRVADLIQADLAEIGIRVRLATRPWSEYRSALYAGVPAMMLYGWTSDNGDPDNFLGVLLGCKSAAPGGANLARWCDPAYEARVEAARRIGARAERRRLYREAQAIAAAAAPWVPIAHTVVHMAVRREVEGFTMDPLGRHLFEDVRLR